MKKSIAMIEQGFESSSSTTPEFAAFFKTFRRELRKEIESAHKIKKIEFHRGHFFVSGFFELEDGKIYYFSFGDVRWPLGRSKFEMLVRTAQHFKDFTGGRNNMVDISRPGFLDSLPN